MSETARFQPGADEEDEEWDTIDEAVRGQYDEVLTKGASLLDGSELMGRLDPLAVFSPLFKAGVSAALHPDKVAGALGRSAGEMLRATTAATVRAQAR
jgi:hypothetical protein